MAPRRALAIALLVSAAMAAIFAAIVVSGRDAGAQVPDIPALEELWDDAAGVAALGGALVDSGADSGFPVPNSENRAAPAPIGGVSSGNYSIIATGASTITINIYGSTKADSHGPTPPDAGADPPIAPEAVPEVPVADLMEHEGYREDPYSLAEKWHVCYGSNSGNENPGAKTPAECVAMLADDIRVALEDALWYVGPEYWSALSSSQQGVVAELAFLVGGAGIHGFGDLQAEIRAGNWEAAGGEIMDSCLSIDRVDRSGCSGPPVAEERLRDMVERLQR